MLLEINSKLTGVLAIRRPVLTTKKGKLPMAEDNTTIHLVPDQPFKVCSVCLTAMPATSQYFGKIKRGKYGVRSQCKSCRAAIVSGKLPVKRKSKEYSDAGELLKTCAKCGVSKPATHEHFHRQHTGRYGFSSICKNCALAARAKYRAENGDKIRAYTKATRVQAAIRSKKWDADHPDRTAARNAKYSAKHPEKMRLKEQLRRARIRSLSATLTDGTWKKALDYFGGRCAYCGRPPGLWHTLAQDHYIPLSDGGGYTSGNIIPACHGTSGCNNSKCDHAPIEWINRKFGKRKGAKIIAHIQAYFDSLKEKE
jgi:hypothetical protein